MLLLERLGRQLIHAAPLELAPWVRCSKTSSWFQYAESCLSSHTGIAGGRCTSLLSQNLLPVLFRPLFTWLFLLAVLELGVAQPIAAQMIAPAITSTSSTTFTVGSAGTFTVTATGSPAPTLSQTGTLPAGASFNAATGVLSGTPATGTGGIYPITLTAQNGVAPNATQNFTLTVNERPAFIPPHQATFRVGTASAFALTTTGFPVPTISGSGAW